MTRLGFGHVQKIVNAESSIWSAVAGAASVNAWRH